VRVWHGRVHRITKELRLQVLRRKRKRLIGTKPVTHELTKPNQRWGMDFVSDSLADGRTFRALAIVDHYTRECPAIVLTPPPMKAQRKDRKIPYHKRNVRT
jgi:putative transposase